MLKELVFKSTLIELFYVFKLPIKFWLIHAHGLEHRFLQFDYYLFNQIR